MSADLRALIEKWRTKGEAELREATDKEMGAAMGVVAMRLHCADELEAALQSSVLPAESPKVVCVCGHGKDEHGNDGAGHCGATPRCRSAEGCQQFRAESPKGRGAPTEDALKIQLLMLFSGCYGTGYGDGLDRGDLNALMQKRRPLFDKLAADCLPLFSAAFRAEGRDAAPPDALLVTEGQPQKTKSSLNALAAKAHKWLETVEQNRTVVCDCGRTHRTYFGLDHHMGENVEGCDFCVDGQPHKEHKEKDLGLLGSTDTGNTRG